MYTIRWLLPVVLAAIPGVALSQVDQIGRSTPVAGPPVAASARIETGPVIDGRLTEEVWRRGTPLGNFVQRDPREGQPSTEKTEVRILSDGEALYLGVQWHVETLVHLPRHMRVFAALIEAAAGASERRAA